MFSVIIPLYNKASFIKNTIESVLCQTFEDYEIIVVNDSSTDGSLDIVQKINDQRIRVYTKPNEGVSAARNFGISKATHKIIAFLDADDVWEKDYLLSISLLVKKYPYAGIYATAYSGYLNGVEKYLSTVKGIPKISLIKDYFKVSYSHGLSINITSATCVRKDILMTMPLFRQNIKRGEDLDVWLRISLTYPMAFYNESKMKYQVDTPSSLSSHYTVSSDDFPYTEWFNMKSTSTYLKKYIVLVIYMSAKNAYNFHDYKGCFQKLFAIWNIEVRVKFLKRIYLVFNSFLKLLK